jgi:hypothetical protein
LSRHTLSTIEIVDGGSEFDLVTARPPSLPVRRGAPMVVAGWAVDTASHTAAGGVILTVDWRWSYRATYGQSRPDVAKALHVRSYARSGFTAVIPTAQLAIGAHSLTLDVLASGSKGYFAPPAATQVFAYGVPDTSRLRRLPWRTDGLIEVVNAGSPVIVIRPGSRSVRASPRSAILVTGWAVDVPARSAARGVVLSVDQRWFFRADYGLNRPDVARALHNSGYAKSGFEVVFPLAGIPRGRHQLFLDVLAKGRGGYSQAPQTVAFTV